jgi:hypothetical protein
MECCLTTESSEHGGVELRVTSPELDVSVNSSDGHLPISPCLLIEELDEDATLMTLPLISGVGAAMAAYENTVAMMARTAKDFIVLNIEVL